VPSLLEIDDATLRFGGVTALDGVSIQVERGSITGLIGPNGAGKTTLLDAISGLQALQRGTIVFDGARIDGQPPHARAGRGLGRTFQSARPLGRMSVLDNVLLAARDQEGERLRRVFGAPWTSRRRERSIRAAGLALLRLVRLDRLADAYASTLSAGQRKLLDLARAMMAEPQLLLVDEPLAGINRTLGRELLDQLRAMRANRGTTFLVVEHDMPAIMGLSDRVLVMNQGRIVAAGTPAEVRADAAVLEAYLGSAGR
jgi:neutral amino acid transport system ATP-binding protein